ncbi:hypothetical protein R3P38DRAFT_3189248 [Favolaschia claudopus]|uniref:Uncharacterized protein n=1 Tax=Favolaschia claudopus TaxID=2862362 RepID=A0AAW0BQR6_9AGAR
MPQDATARQKKNTNHEKTNHRFASSKNTDDSSSRKTRSRHKTGGRQPPGAEKENKKRLNCELCQSNGILVPATVNGVADRSIPKPRNLKKEVNVNIIRAHMGIDDAGSKRVWLNCRARGLGSRASKMDATLSEDLLAIDKSVFERLTCRRHCPALPMQSGAATL